MKKIVFAGCLLASVTSFAGDRCAGENCYVRTAPEEQRLVLLCAERVVEKVTYENCAQCAHVVCGAGCTMGMRGAAAGTAYVVGQTGAMACREEMDRRSSVSLWKRFATMVNPCSVAVALCMVHQTNGWPCFCAGVAHGCCAYEHAQAIRADSAENKEN